MKILKNNKGMTLVEALIAVVITSIILTTLFSFLNVVNRQYTKANREVSVQNEVQTMMMQLENIIIDAEVDVAVDGNKLYVLNEESFSVIGYNGTDQYLYYYQLSASSTSDNYKNASDRSAKLSAAKVDDTIIVNDTTLPGYLFAENVSAFSPVPHFSSTENYVSLILELNKEGVVYRSTKNVFLRNQIVEPTPGASVTPTPTPTPVP